MRAVVATTPGGPEVLRVVHRPDPTPRPGELLVRVAATAVNRADVLQRRGMYPPPPGASDVLGLEASGVVEAIGSEVTGWSVGDPVCAVLPGGGHAELVVVPASVSLPVPPGLSLVEAAAVPEVFTTAYDNVLVRGRLRAGETLLVHGAGSPQRVRACLELGADDGFVYRDADIAAEVLARTDGRGADVILDVVGGPYLEPNLRALAVEGRLVVIGLQGGAKAELDLSLVMTRRLSVAGSTLRARSVAEREPVMAGLLRDVWPGFADGSLRPVIDRVLPLERVAEAHAAMEASEHVGKIVLRV
jgi:NADPH:quinone reductase-like Zn-dependent oxidoreductase